MRRLLSNAFILLGLLCFLLVGYLFWQRTNPQRLSFDLEERTTFGQPSSGGTKPVKLIIADLNIDLPIYPAKIEKNKWEATTKGVSYLASSPSPSEVGNSILYGHNWPNLLGSLTKAKPGQRIQIIFDNGATKNFIIEKTAIVSPKQISVLSQTADRRITVYTCTGFFDQNRFVATALLEEN